MKKKFVNVTVGLILAALALGIIPYLPMFDLNQTAHTTSSVFCDRVPYAGMPQDGESLPKNRNPVVAPSILVFLGGADNIKVDFPLVQTPDRYRISSNSVLHDNFSARNVPRAAPLSLLNQVLRI